MGRFAQNKSENRRKNWSLRSKLKKKSPGKIKEQFLFPFFCFDFEECNDDHDILVLTALGWPNKTKKFEIPSLKLKEFISLQKIIQPIIYDEKDFLSNRFAVVASFGDGADDDI